MIVDPKVQFRLSLGSNVLRCEDKRFGKVKQVEERPKVAAKPDEKILKEMENNNLLARVIKALKSDEIKKNLDTIRQM